MESVKIPKKTVFLATAGQPLEAKINADSTQEKNRAAYLQLLNKPAT